MSCHIWGLRLTAAAAPLASQESLNTVKYSNRARAIQNKPIINFGPKASAVVRGASPSVTIQDAITQEATDLDWS
jgi:hypothetical protein